MIVFPKIKGLNIFRIRTNDLPGKRAHLDPLNCVYIQLFKYLYNIPLKFWPFYYQWKWMKSEEHDQTRVPKPLPAEIKRWRLQEWFSNIAVQLNFTGTKTLFAEIFHTDIHEAQIFKIRGFRSTLKARFYGAILKLIFQGQHALSKGHVLRLRCSFEVNL